MPQILGRAAAQTYGADLRTGNFDLLTSVEVADPDIADAHQVSDQQLIILGKKIGATNILLYDTKRKLIGVVDVEVKLDTRGLGSKIREGSGGKGIQVNDVNGKLVLSGNGGDSKTVERAICVAADLAPRRRRQRAEVTTPQQVMLKVRFVEATRTAARNLGVRWEFIRRATVAGVVGTQAGTKKFDVLPSSNFGNAAGPNGEVFDAVAGLGGASPFATILTQIINTSSGKLDVVLSALEEQRVIRQLAEPNLIAPEARARSEPAGFRQRCDYFGLNNTGPHDPAGATNFPGWGRVPSSARCSGARPIRPTRPSLSSS